MVGMVTADFCTAGGRKEMGGFTAKGGGKTGTYRLQLSGGQGEDLIGHI